MCVTPSVGNKKWGVKEKGNGFLKTIGWSTEEKWGSTEKRFSGTKNLKAKSALKAFYITLLFADLILCFEKSKHGTWFFPLQLTFILHIRVIRVNMGCERFFQVDQHLSTQAFIQIENTDDYQSQTPIQSGRGKNREPLHSSRLL